MGDYKRVSISIDGEGEVEFFLDEPTLNVLKRAVAYQESGGACGAAALKAIINRALAKCLFEHALDASAIAK